MAQMLVRPPDGLKDELQRRAQQMGITLNALVLQILWDWMKENQSRADDQPGA
ncbi:hypothetical protein [Flavonifractor plautii]|uniref:hypothetical protein n=1 Tax=Flavonifractor plautii TaxID=292800 RepID=UPI0024B87C33|nr:hypothetical protein [Flavonifractor plautii]